MKDEKGYFYIIDAFLAVLILLIVILMVNSIVSMSNPNYSVIHIISNQLRIQWSY